MYSGKRSEEALQRRIQRKAAREYIIKYSFNDTIKDEVTSRTDPSEVQTFLGETFGHCEQSAVPCTYKGIILTDSYGNGAHQNKWCEKCGCQLTPFNIAPEKEVFLCRKCQINGEFKKNV
jgi:hypothetical protein